MSSPLLRFNKFLTRAVLISALMLLALHIGGCARSDKPTGDISKRDTLEQLAAHNAAKARTAAAVESKAVPVPTAEDPPEAAVTSNEAPPPPARRGHGLARRFAAAALDVLSAAVQRFEQVARQQEQPPAATPAEEPLPAGENGLPELALPAIALCTEVMRFGVYEPLAAAFPVGRPHETVLYVEVDGFAAQQAGDGTWETRMIFSAVLLDPMGEPLVEIAETEVIDRSRQRRRDFFLCTDFKLPATAPPGTCTLVVSLRDELSGLTTEGTLSINLLDERPAALR